MATLLSKLDSSRRSPSLSSSEYNLCYLHSHMEKPGVPPATVRLALVLLGTLAVTMAALLSLARLVMN